MTKKVPRGSFLAECPSCPFERTYSTQAHAARGLRIHSCQHHRELAARIVRVEAAKTREGVKRDCQCMVASHRHGTRAAYVADKCRCRKCMDAATAAESSRNRAKAYGRYDNGKTDATPARQHLAYLMHNGISLKRTGILSGLAFSTLSNIVYGRTERNEGPQKQILHATAETILSIQPTLDTMAPGRAIDATGTHRRVQALVTQGYTVSTIGKRLGFTASNFHGTLHREYTTVKTARAVRVLYEQLWDQPNQATDRLGRAATTRARRYADSHDWMPPMAWDDDTIDDPAATPAGTETADRQAAKTAFIENVTFLAEAGERLPDVAKRLGTTKETIERRLQRYHQDELLHALRTPTGPTTGLGQRGTRAQAA